MRAQRNAVIGLGAVMLSVLLSADGRTLNAQPAARDELRVYTTHDRSRVESVLRRFRRGGTSIEVLTGPAWGLVSLLRQTAGVPDVVLIEGVTYLDDAERARLLRRFETARMREAIPYPLRSTEGGWFSMSYVVRGVVSRSNAKAASTATSVWSLGTGSAPVCLASQDHLRNRLLIADAARNAGSRGTNAWAGWLMPAGSTAGIVQSVRSGTCAFAVVHSDDMAAARATPLLKGLLLSWPEGKDGAPIVQTGIGMTTRSKNYSRARELLEWMASDEGQKTWSAAMLGYPASEFVPPPVPVLELGRIRPDVFGRRVTADELAEAARHLTSIRQ